ncbi:MAG: tetratricopeptide repeat protein, partial [Acidobacteriota bacterium]|nr:tetratricopeptide repeat protein [Acidobacteriota bacterium]
WYTAALLKKPDDVNVRTDLGITYLLRAPADPARAITEFRRSLERDPTHVPTLQNLVVALTRKGEKQEARATLTKLEQLAPDNPTLPRLRAELDAKSPASAASASGTE